MEFLLFVEIDHLLQGVFRNRIKYSSILPQKCVKSMGHKLNTATSGLTRLEIFDD